MKAIFVLISAGIRRKKMQMGVFAAGCFLCSFFLLGVFVLNFALDASFDRTYGRLDAPDMRVSVEQSGTTETALTVFLNRLSYVRDYKVSQCYLASNVKLPERSMEFAFLASGTGIEPDAGCVVINNAVYGVYPGDEIEISINGHSISLKVDAVVTDAVNSAPESMIPYFWMNEQELEELTVGFDKGTYLVEMKTENIPETVQNFVMDYEEYFGQPFDGDMTSYDDIRHSYLFRYKIFSKFILFLFIFLFLIILIMTVLLSRMAVYSDRKKIGILKSIGFTDDNINLSYILQYVLTAVAANVFGALSAGVVLQTWLSGMFANIDRNLFGIKNLWGYGFLAILIMGIVVYLAVRLSICQIVHMPPVESIKNTDVHKKRGNLSAFIFVLTLGISLLYLLAVYMIDGVKNADRHLTDWGIVEMDVYVSRKTNTDERKSGLLEALENDSAVNFYYAGLSDNIIYRLEGNGITRKVTGEVYDQEIPEGLDYIFTEGRNPQTGNEVAVGINFASKNHVSIGDKIFITRYGEETELEIVGIYPSFKQYGDSIRFLTDDIQKFFGNRADGYYSIVLNDGEDVNAFSKRMAEEFTDFNFFPMERSTTRSVRMLMPPIAVCIGLFALIYCLILLCMKKIMVMECKRDLEIYGFIGFTAKKVNAVVRWRFVIPIFFGTVIAIPLSIYAMPACLNPAVRTLGLSSVPIYPNTLLVLTALTGIIVCGFAALCRIKQIRT